MNVTTTEEFVREAHGAACSTWKTKFENEFPDLFKLKLEVGRWYKNVNKALANYQGGKNGYGFSIEGEWMDKENWSFNYPKNWIPATSEEVESALIAEAKKRGYKPNNFKCISIPNLSGKLDSDRIYFEHGKLWMGSEYNSNCIFQRGQWAEIIPQNKVITLDEAKKILAKKYGTTPDKIEINNNQF